MSLNGKGEYHVVRTNFVDDLIDCEQRGLAKRREVLGGVLDRIGALNVLGGGLEDALGEVLGVGHVEKR